MSINEPITDHLLEYPELADFIVVIYLMSVLILFISGDGRT